MPRQTGASWRPAYDRATFAHAVRHGLDTRQIALAPAMPRYDLTDAQVAALWQFLRDGAPILAPGFTDTEVRVGFVVPAGVWGGSALIGQDPFEIEVLRQVVAEMSHPVTVHDRQLRWIALKPEDLRHVDNLQSSDRSVCAVLAPSGSISPAALTSLAQSGALVIAPDPQTAIADQPAVLRLTPSVEQQRAAGLKHVQKPCPQAQLPTTLPAWPGQIAPAPRSSGRDHAHIAAALLVQFLQAAGRVAPHVSAWLDLPRSGRAWHAGHADVRVSWGLRTRSAWSDVWVLSACHKPLRWSPK